MAKTKDFRKNAAELFISAAPDPEPAKDEPVTTKEPSATIANDGNAIPKGYKLVKENKSDRMQLLIRPAVKNALKQEATAQGVSMNDLTNSILEEYLERKGRL